MAATVTTPQLVGVGVQKPENESFPWTLTSRWHATKLSDGTAADVTITTDLASADPLEVSDWDTIFDAAMTAYASVYANAPTSPPPNPIDF